MNFTRTWRNLFRTSPTPELDHVTVGAMQRHPMTGQLLRTFDSLDPRVKLPPDPRNKPGPRRMVRSKGGWGIDGREIEAGEVVELDAATAWNVVMLQRRGEYAD